jgi:hypothetical protein
MLASVLVILTTCQTSEAHCYSVWRYPYPQPCHSIRHPLPKPPLPPILEASEREQSGTGQEQITIPLPSLVFEPCQDGDERMQGIARLRAIANDLW